MGERWTKDEDRVLMDGVGVFSVDWYRRKTGRSADALYSRSRQLYGAGGLSRGTHSLRDAAESTGYTRQQLLRAQSALGQKWKRLSARGRYLITFEQLQQLVVWLRHDYWYSGLRLYGCVNCGSNSRPARGMGLCSRDFWRVRRTSQRLGLPSSLSRLRELIRSQDIEQLGIRSLAERLEKGWGPTIEQLEDLAVRLASLN